MKHWNRGRILQSVAIVLLLGALPFCLVWREYRQARLNQELNRELIVAVKHEDAKAVATLMEQGADANSSELEKPPSFTEALTSLFNRWRRHSAQAAVPADSALALILDEEERDGAHSCDDIAATLVSHGADISLFVCDRQPTVVEYAFARDMHQTVRALLQRGVKLQNRLILMADAENTKALLLHGVDPNARDDDGETALMCPFCDGELRLDKVGLLLAVGADSNARDNEGQSVLFHAKHDWAGHDKRQLIHLLLAHGAKELP